MLRLTHKLRYRPKPRHWRRNSLKLKGFFMERVYTIPLRNVKKKVKKGLSELLELSEKYKTSLFKHMKAEEVKAR